MTPARIPQDLIDAFCLEHHWNHHDNYIERTFTFDNYAEGVGFVVRVSALAEHYNHHPVKVVLEWKRVTVVYFTVSAGGVTALDLKIAQQLA